MLSSRVRESKPANAPERTLYLITNLDRLQAFRVLEGLRLAGMEAGKR
jgi:hypothetical protein